METGFECPTMIHRRGRGRSVKCWRGSRWSGYWGCARGRRARGWTLVVSRFEVLHRGWVNGNGRHNWCKQYNLVLWFHVFFFSLLFTNKTATSRGFVRGFFRTRLGLFGPVRSISEAAAEFGYPELCSLRPALLPVVLRDYDSRRSLPPRLFHLESVARFTHKNGGSNASLGKLLGKLQFFKKKINLLLSLIYPYEHFTPLDKGYIHTPKMGIERGSRTLDRRRTCQRALRRGRELVTSPNFLLVYREG